MDDAKHVSWGTKHASRAAVPHCDADAITWAARSGAPSSDVYARWLSTRAATAAGAARAKGRTLELIDRDRFRVAARARRKPVKRQKVKKGRTPGEVWHIDHYPHDVPSPVDGSTGQYLGVCTVSDYGYAKNVKRHTADDLVAYVTELMAHCHRYKRVARLIVLDRGSENACAALRTALAAQRLDVEVAPRGHHERVGCVEAKQDVLSRHGDAQLKRAQQSAGYHLHARMDLLDRLNLIPPRGRKVSRWEHFTGEQPPSLRETPPYVYGVEVNVLEDEQARGAHQGKGRQGRSSLGTLLRCSRSGYMIVKHDTRQVVYPRHVTPLNEKELVRGGLPSGAACDDVKVGTPSEGIPRPPPPPPPPAAPPPPPTPLRVDGVPVGTRIEVQYKPSARDVRGGAPDAPQYYPGTVEQIRESGHTRHHLIAFDGWSGSIWHDLAGAHAWRLLPPVGAPPGASASPVGPPKGPPPIDGDGAAASPKAPSRPKPSPRTAFRQPSRPPARASARLKAAADGCVGDGGAPRAAARPPAPEPPPRGSVKSAGRRARSAVLTAALDDALATSDEPSVLFTACVAQWCGADARSLPHPTHEEEVPSAMRAFYRWELETLQAGDFSALAAVRGFTEDERSVLKATTYEVNIDTPLGPSVIKVPKTQREVETSPQRDEWLMGLQKAVDAILVQPLNSLVRISAARESGTDLADCTVVFTAKTDKATGKLLDDWAKVRCCFDETKPKNIKKAKARREGTKVEKPAEPFSSVVADSMLVRCIFARAATGRRLTKADVKDAYSKGTRRGAKRYMRMPRLMRSYTEDGEELVFELGSPMWGEYTAGRDWQETIEAELLRLGWRQAECVPAMYTFEDATTGAHAELVTVVDDMLFSESGEWGPYDPASSDPRHGEGPIAARTLAALRARFGTVTSEVEPRSFVGRKIERDWATAALTISMPHTIETMVDEHYPEFRDGKPKGLLSGKALHEAADSLRMRPVGERPTKLDASQTKTRRVLGALTWQCSEVKPRLAVGCHCLACVGADPPPLAADVAKALAWWSWATRHEGITYGGRGPGEDLGVMGAISSSFSMDEGAPSGPHVAGDATWRGGEESARPDVIGLLATMNYGGIGWTTKLTSLKVDSSHENEAIASAKAGELNANVREIARAQGIKLKGPTEILTDNLANEIVANRKGWPTRSRHFLRRYHSLLRRCGMGECYLRKVSDAENPSDFLTKWLPATKLNRSVAYVENSGARVGGCTTWQSDAWCSRAEARARGRLHRAGFGADGAALPA